MVTNKKSTLESTLGRAPLFLRAVLRPLLSEVSKKGWREGFGDQQRPKCTPEPKTGHAKAGRSDVDFGSNLTSQGWSLGASSDAHSALQNNWVAVPGSEVL